MTAGTRYRLSKSKIAAFEHCPRRLWLQIHQPEAAHYDTDTLERFRFGHAVGARAAGLVPDGIMIEAEPDMQAALKLTAELVAQDFRQPLFEATFQYQDVLVRADILQPSEDGSWHAIEVKASAHAKPYQISDLATQVWVMRGCGLTISKAIIRHLAPPFSWKHTEIASLGFADSDVTAAVDRRVISRQIVAVKARSAIRDAEPYRPQGPWCSRPLACEFQRHCKLASAHPLLARM